MADLSSNILMTDLNTNSLNSLRKMQRFSQWINAIIQLWFSKKSTLNIKTLIAKIISTEKNIPCKYQGKES